jgi:hypothetical protein
MIRPKPWWLRAITASYQWVTIAPHIYHPSDRDPLAFPAILAHEDVHLRRQQRMGVWSWLWRYLTSRSFRLAEEAMGIAAEIRAEHPDRQRVLLETYSEALASSVYLWAASCPQEARMAILDAVDHP